VEKKIEVPIEIIKIQTVEKIVEVIKEVEKIIVKEEENCDCLTGVKFINAWNKLFKINGNVGSDCITEKQFISIVQKSLNTNAAVLMEQAEGNGELEGTGVLTQQDNFDFYNKDRYLETTNN
jgi:hypothetical protein